MLICHMAVCERKKLGAAAISNRGVEICDLDKIVDFIQIME